MDRMNNSLIAVSAVSGALLGWVVKKSFSKRQERVDYKPFVERVKNRERNFYAEGRKHALEIENIKQEVHHKIKQ